MTSQKRRNRLAKGKLLESLAIDADGGCIPDFPDETFHLGNTEKLSHDQVRSCVYLVMLLLDLPSGNSGGRNLYELLDLYLRDSKARDQINGVLVRFGRNINGWPTKTGAVSQLLCLADTTETSEPERATQFASLFADMATEQASGTEYSIEADPRSGQIRLCREV